MAILPKYDEENQQFVEPNLPNNKIGILHLAGGIYNEKNIDLRDDKNVKINILTLNNETLLKSLRFSSIG